MTDESNLRVLNTISLFCILLLNFKSSWLTHFDRFQKILRSMINLKEFNALRVLNEYRKWKILIPNY